MTGRQSMAATINTNNTPKLAPLPWLGRTQGDTKNKQLTTNNQQPTNKYQQ